MLMPPIQTPSLPVSTTTAAFFGTRRLSSLGQPLLYGLGVFPQHDQRTVLIAPLRQIRSPVIHSPRAGAAVNVHLQQPLRVLFRRPFTAAASW